MVNDINYEFEIVEQLHKRKYPLLCGCVKDGILYPDLYETSPLKLMIVLAEPLVRDYGNIQAPLDVDLNIEDAIFKLETHCLQYMNKTWIKIAAMAYALKYRKEYSENLSWNQVKEGLSCVSLIHLSKTPWREKTDIKDPLYRERVCDWEPVIKKQLLTIKYDIILYGQTWDCSSINPIIPNEVWDYRKMTDFRMYSHSIINHKMMRMQVFRYENSRQIIVNGYHPYNDEYSAGLQTQGIMDYLDRA